MHPQGARSHPRPTPPPRTLATPASVPIRLPPLSHLPAHLPRLALRALHTFRGLSAKTKAIVVLIALVYSALLVTVLRIGTHGILEYLSGFALFFSRSSVGPALLLLIIIAFSFPPLIGYGTSITMCGLSFGSPESGPGHGLFLAWGIAAAGCLMGSTASFLLARWGLARYGDRFESVRDLRGGKEWRAMEKAVERKGWKMAILIRLCPFPFVYSNLFFSSLRPTSVTLPLFLLATLCTTPKLLLHVFVGAKAFEAIQSGKNGQPHSKSWLSVASIVGASLSGAVTSWYIYRETKKVLDSFVEEDEEEDRINAEEQGRRIDHPRGDTCNGQHWAGEESWGWSDEEGETRKKRETKPSSNATHRQNGAMPFTLGDVDAGDSEGGDDADEHLYGAKEGARRSLLNSRTSIYRS